MSWNANEEHLRCLLVLSDAYAPALSPRAGPAFFRAFIVEDRATGEVWMKCRHRYKDPDERSWIEIRPKQQADENRDDAVQYLVDVMTTVLRTGARAVGNPLPPDAIQAFYPPDDGGDVGRTIIWLEMKGLIEIVAAESA